MMRIGATVRLLDPVERTMEVLFGLIMVLSFTGTLSVADAGRDDVRAMLIGALGCNLAWGLIDGVMYLMTCLAERGHKVRTLRAARGASDAAGAQRIVAGALPPLLASVLEPDELASITRRIIELPDAPARPRLGREDWLGAVAVFFWVFVSTFPVALPFLFMEHARGALRVSNGIAIALLFVAGYLLGKYSGIRAWWAGLGMVLVGVALVAITIALGG